MSSQPQEGAPRRQLTLFDSTCIIVGIIIGSGIYVTTPIIAGNVPSANALLITWIAGGIVAFLGALCYAELSTSFPEDGGDYVFLTRGFGRPVGFLFAWAEFWIIRPGNIGMMAFAFARYANRLYPLRLADHERYDYVVYAALAVLALTAINLRGVRAGKWSQNVLTVAKVIGLAAICLVGLTEAAPAAELSAPTSESSSLNWRLAMILVLFTYGGWNEMSYVAAEVKNPERNIFWALVIGSLTVMAIYVIANYAFLQSLGFEGVRTSNALAADVLRGRYGENGARLMSICVCLSCLGAVNGMMFTGSRIYYTLGTQHRLFAWLGRWSPRYDGPVRSLLVQTTFTLILIAGFGWYEDGFTRLLDFTAPVFWLFIFMVGVALFVLRSQPPLGTRPYRVLGYPWIPIVFCIVCALLADSSLTYAINQGGNQAFLALGILIVGGIVGWWDSIASRK